MRKEKANESRNKLITTEQTGRVGTVRGRGTQIQEERILWQMKEVVTTKKIMTVVGDG